MSKISQRSVPQVQARNYVIAAWLLSLITVAVSLFAWGPNYNWNFLPLQAYQIFPLLGLIAFGLMWAHYMNGAIREMAEVPAKPYKYYYQYTGYVVLACILLHPALLIYQRYRDGFGLPPHSYITYVEPGLGWITLLGTVSFFIFIAFEFHRVFGKYSWWRYVTDASDFAMLAILYHGFKLGGQLQMNNWFREVWLLYTVTLVLILGRKYYLRFSKK